MPKRVLIADDDAALAENLSEILQAFDIPSVVASTFAEVLANARDDRFDVALIDLRLPDGSGGDLVRALRERSPTVQSILITGDATVETAAEAVSHGAFAYILKPFAPEKLVETVQRALAQAQLLRERTRLRTQLELSEKRHRDLVEAIPALVVALDGNGLITLWNRRLEEITGFSSDEMVGTDGRVLVQNGVPTSLPIKAGGNRLVRWDTAEVGAGSTYAVGIDVTSEQQMLRRTMRAERLAAVGTMAAGLAHEIRNPLNAAMLQLTLLERRLAKPELDRSALAELGHVVQSEIKRLERLLSDFLAFARPRELQIKSVCLTTMCSEVLELMAPEIERAAVVVQRQLDADLPRVEGDPERLKQVLLNLIRNAVEAMPDGGTLKIAVQAAEKFIDILVEDSGVGMEDESAVFDAFYTTKSSGTGLGLSLVHRIVADHGGQIGVESRPGRTCLKVSLPLHSTQT